MRRLLAVLMTASLSAVPVRAGEITVKTLPNGLKWIHRPVKHNKIAAFALMFPGGPVDEPAGKSGLTMLMTSVMFKGTASRSALDVAKQVESLGASLETHADEDYWDLHGQVTTDRFDQAFEVFQDVLLHPSFPQDEFEKEKLAQLNEIRSKKERIFDVAYERLQAEVFGAHPYARPQDGTEESVGSITREDLVKWHKRRLDPRGAVLITVGDLPVRRLEKLFTAAFADWTAPATKEPAVSRPAYPAEQRVVEETHPFEQSYTMLAYPAPGSTDPDYAALKVLNAHLGAGMSSPLFQVVREQGTLAYEVSSFFPSRKLGSAFVVYAGTDPANLDLAEKKMREVIADFLKKPLDAAALANAKRYIRGHYMMDHQTNARLGWYLGWWEILGLGYAHDAEYMKRIDAVTVADVTRAAAAQFGKPVTIVRIRSKN